MSRGWIVVTGCSSGLGYAICQSLTMAGHSVFGLDIRPDPGSRLIRDGRHCDVSNRDDVEAAADQVVLRGDVLGIINCAGINHIEWLQKMDVEDWDKVLDVNAKSIFLMSRAFLAPLQESRGFILNIVSNAAHVPMRCSLAYNASKAAAHMMTLQLARELSPGVTVFGIAPNKLKGTGMSKYIEERVPELRGWTEEQARAYQQQALMCGAETPPERVAEFITFLLSDRERHRYLTGTVLPYGA